MVGPLPPLPWGHYRIPPARAASAGHFSQFFCPGGIVPQHSPQGLSETGPREYLSSLPPIMLMSRGEGGVRPIRGAARVHCIFIQHSTIYRGADRMRGAAERRHAGNVRHECCVCTIADWDEAD
eukprot:gene10281-biopygen4766